MESKKGEFLMRRTSSINEAKYVILPDGSAKEINHELEIFSDENSDKYDMATTSGQRINISLTDTVLLVEHSEDSEK